jgi:hypothetical protein
MIVGVISELSIVGVFDRGKPNEERVILRATELVNLGQYGLMIGVRGSDGMAFPIRDNLLWFGDALLNPDDWLVVYTGPGTPRATRLPNSVEWLYSVHWGRSITLLHDPNLVPILFRVDAVQIPGQTLMLPEPHG